MSGLNRRFVRRARYERDRVARRVLNGFRHRAIARNESAPRERAHVFYGIDRLPSRGEVAFGGIVKFQLLAETFPNAPRDFNLLYMGSSSRPPDAPELVRLARRRGAVFVWNQNGVAYPGWFGPGYERYNEVPARLLHAADHVVFQTAFCKLAADRFYGERQGSWEILPNPVDTSRFTPPGERPQRPLTLLLGGNQYQGYRMEAALRALAQLPACRLLVTGALSWSRDAPAETELLIRDLGLAGRVELLGPYSQSEAPSVIQRADILIHPKVNDPCPTIVLEAMACGLPVVYSATGGTPELVGDEAGVGIPGPLDWEHDRPPEAEALAAAVEDVGRRLDALRPLARRRAERFDARRFIARHRELFGELLGRKEPQGHPLP